MGKKGRVGVTLKIVDEPDKIEGIKLDRRKLPPGNYKEVGYESRQVFDIDISRIVTEYQAQILADSKGKQCVAPFPKGVTKAVQYGTSLKAHSVYRSQFQLIPYKRIQEYFREQLDIPVSDDPFTTFMKKPTTYGKPLTRKSKRNLPAQICYMLMKRALIMNGDKR